MDDADDSLVEVEQENEKQDQYYVFSDHEEDDQ
jgi:hypothetical protein